MKRTALIILLLLAACREEVAATAPVPVAMTDEALGHYCQMALSEMEGPKAQIHLAGIPDPIFFAQVRDGIAYLKEPEKTGKIVALYVSDLSHAPSWVDPGEDNWVDAEIAYFVVGARVAGGMGAPELAPFSARSDALAFAADHGGMVMQFADIPTDAVLGAVETVELERSH
ncbi:MAG: nitrous oxide reductase accessory protein NosL [Boseongicola sp.]